MFVQQMLGRVCVYAGMHFICQFGFNQVFKSRGVKSALRDFNCLLSTNFIINFYQFIDQLPARLYFKIDLFLGY